MKHTNQERKVYPMKFTKFIPLALALVLTVPAFADPASSQTDDLDFTISPFFNITKNTGKNYTGTVSVDDAYTTLTMTGTPMSFGYHVISNKNNTGGGKDAVDLKITALSQGGTQANALGGTPAAPVIVFSNNTATGTYLPTAAEINNALTGSATKSDTPNCIAFTLSPTVAKVANTGITATAPDPGEGLVTKGDFKVIHYTFDNGEYNFDYVVDSVNNDTFSTYDTNGLYKATILMSQVAP